MQSEALTTVIIAARYGYYERRGEFLTIDHVLYSYGVELARYDKEDKHYIANGNCYHECSLTTRKHQDAILATIDRQHLEDMRKEQEQA